MFIFTLLTENPTPLPIPSVPGYVCQSKNKKQITIKMYKLKIN